MTDFRGRRASFRFYQELNDFLPAGQRGRSIDYFFDGNPGIKDPIEALGVPHTEVELIIVNGRSRGFDYQLRDGDRVAVYPVFESLDISPLVKIRSRPLRQVRFIADVHLGKLARYLRLLGFDTLYRNDYRDEEIVRQGVAQRRVILTRDRRLLYNAVITHGYYVRSVVPEEQVAEVVARFDLGGNIHPFHRCLHCNGLIEPVAKSAVLDRLEPLTARYYREFFQCASCGKLYWKGSHYHNLLDKLNRLLEGSVSP
jgi:hypothetical protein